MKTRAARILLRCVTALAICVFGAGAASATTIYMNSGTAGVYYTNQSYNETRSVDVTVLSLSDLAVSSMTLNGTGEGLAKVVIYDSSTQLLIASGLGNVTSGTTTVSISATLLSGHEYRIGFFGFLGAGTVFAPAPIPATNGFPYIESSGLLRINSAWNNPMDNFPAFPNLAVPQVSLQVSAVPEPGTLALLPFGLALSWVFRKKSGARKI